MIPKLPARNHTQGKSTIDTRHRLDETVIMIWSVCESEMKANLMIIWSSGGGGMANNLFLVSKYIHVITFAKLKVIDQRSRELYITARKTYDCSGG